MKYSLRIISWSKAAVLLGAMLLCCLATHYKMTAYAQSPFSIQEKRTIKAPKALALPPDSPVARRRLTGTAFFVDGKGHLLTARHVVENCAQVIVVKERQSLSAKIVAAGSRSDLALLKTSKTMGLAAVFPRTAVASRNEMVFAGAYDTLEGALVGGGVIANSRIIDGAEADHLAIDSPVTFGASGAPVLDRLGLVQGVVSRRTSSERVQAVDAATVKAFLAANGVHFEQDDRPQISGSASRAQRAATISARVTCIQH